MDGVPGWPEVFRGSAAVSAGLVTWGQLRGPRFQRLFPDIYAPASEKGPPLKLRSRGAGLLVDGRGAVSGYSAAEMLGAACAPKGAPAEVTVSGRQRQHPGLLIHRDRLARDEVQRVGGLWVTTPLRTAFDLARRLDFVEGVVAVDALANRHRFHPDMLLHLSARHRGARGVDRIPEVLTHATRWSGSPMESRLRMIIVGAGLPLPELQWVVQDMRARTAIWLDMAWPELKIAIEYEGDGHAAQEVVLRDVCRYTRLVDDGWRIYRYTKYEVYGEPRKIITQLTRARQRSRGT